MEQCKNLGDYQLLTLYAGSEFRFVAGQYVKIRFHDQDEVFERYYSLANAPNSDAIVQFCVQRSDPKVVSILDRTPLQGKMEISTPMGRFRLADDKRPVVLVAGGAGIAPMRAFFLQLTSHFASSPDRPLHLVYGCKTAAAIPGKEEFIAYKESFPDDVKIWLLAEHGCDHNLVRQGLVTDVLDEAHLSDCRYYVCGPSQMIAAVKALLSQMGVAEDDILQDPF